MADVRATLVLCLGLVAAEAQAMDIAAHRGASHDAPENTLAAFRLGFAQGADALECDVHLTRDGALAVIHDPRTLRTAGEDLEVASQEFARLGRLDVGRWKAPAFAGERIPGLEQVLALLPPGKRALVELKCGPEALPALARVVRASGKAGQVWLMSFREDSLAAARAELPELPAIWLHKAPRDARGAPGPFPPALAGQARARGFQGLGLQSPGLTAELARAAREARLLVLAWTVDEPSEGRRLEALGVDVLITNRPGFMRAELGSGAGRGPGAEGER
ncbi:MAG TPA: glycerophosphodiester phosphodiesterase family protein [Myxococcota bacterium]|nr:glycerophosphodiester phosphodiesterase family protein [Myxococcota bacterium]HRY94908.1 glycerophosphodiester phosphodiesterase family protein [Myxococcota bacterium]HSA21814.1 glycerophosphodiester phosphodiesterase family protein [Myxococcota bacterium]